MISSQYAKGFPLGFIRKRSLFPLGFIIFSVIIPLGFHIIAEDGENAAKSNRTIATVTFPLKSAIQRLNVTDSPDVGKNVGKNLSIRQRQIIDLMKDNPPVGGINAGYKLQDFYRCLVMGLQIPCKEITKGL